ncbi:hypothetical protein NS228_19060 [Methylobacterium indicum]|uniref:Uncharacterized protein n=1 Tax=Methylobacterium indicum TaxID=1775910 RepID=A0ABR5H6V9_9HYPH|nr:hypothetical protein QR78_22600 [Methylobacterium indicum]KMO20108.1 hypothetical protein QR79_18780 [Methylobacterium indicum]KTS24707.1 hypothetical protein NS229_21890 [Methylobacterium indicum]KTS37520.1 hypothetical protein NS228_19060 [Methylobacterium indicum]KTS42287.1 hypothetical protein NS230_28155 [Methylobacterium indicum]
MIRREALLSALFDPILNWRLLPGSHPFPGPDGGTCINEAALVAAGLPYRAIRSSADCPPCFSVPLAAYALGLNDAMPDDERPRLMVFVLRLAGSADDAAIEDARTAHLVLEGVRRLLPPVLERAGLRPHAAACRSADDLGRAVTVARHAAWAAGSLAEAAGREGAWARGATAAAAARAARSATEIDARTAADAAEAAALFWPGAWAEAVAILDEAARIGRQAPALGLDDAAIRLEAAKAARHGQAHAPV